MPAPLSPETVAAGQLLRRCRRILELTVPDLAAGMGCDPRTVTRWQAGEAAIPGSVWAALYFLLRQYKADPALINALPTPRGLPFLYPRVSEPTRPPPPAPEP